MIENTKEARPFEHLADDVDAVKDAAALLAAMANPKRLHMLQLLCKGEMCVRDLTKAVRLNQSSASQHLTKLRAGGFVETRRDAQQIFYICGNEKVKRLLAILHDLHLDAEAPRTSPAGKRLHRRSSRR